MRIGFDAKRLFFNHTGLGVYSRNLLMGFREFYPQNEYHLFARKATKSNYYHSFSDLPTHAGGGPLWRSWRMASQIERANCQIFHGLSHEIPIGIASKLPTIVTIHDVIFRREPHLFPLIDRKIYDRKWAYSTKYADKIIAVSESTKTDIQTYYGVPSEKISVIYPPIARKASEQISTQVTASLKLPDRYFLYVGAISRRKNLMGIINAYERLNIESRIPMVVIGSNNNYQKHLQQEIIKRNLAPWILFAGHVPNEHLSFYYGGALALIYPSFYEGFGIPIVEALRCRTPVITSNTSSMPEAAGPGALLVDPANPDDIAKAMQKLIRDPDLGAKLGAAGHRYVARFEVQAICQQIMSLYELLLQKQKRP